MKKSLWLSYERSDFGAELTICPLSLASASEGAAQRMAPFNVEMG